MFFMQAGELRAGAVARPLSAENTSWPGGVGEELSGDKLAAPPPARASPPAGFAMLCAGSVRAKNAKNIILLNILDACFGCIGWCAQPQSSLE